MTVRGLLALIQTYVRQTGSVTLDFRSRAVQGDLTRTWNTGITLRAAAHL
jgi:hypothetical protein